MRAKEKSQQGFIPVLKKLWRVKDFANVTIAESGGFC
jgi:hypothetical protein